MKLSGREAVRFFEKPDNGRAGVLIYGPDPMRVALRRQQVIAALIGPAGEEEMRLTRLAGADLRKDATLLSDGMKAQGFFPGPRVVFVEDATDGLSNSISVCLDDWQDGDAILVVTGGQLKARASLRKLFEGHSNAYAAAVYTDPPSRGEIEAMVAKVGIKAVDSAAMSDLVTLSRELDPGEFQQTIEKLALYTLGADAPVSSADIVSVAPLTSEAALDEALHLIAEARFGEVGQIMRRLEGQGTNPTTICIGATRHFRALHVAASHPKGVEAGLAATRPPVFGPRRDRMARQARALGMQRIENMLTILTDTDLDLRSARLIPARAMLERAFIRIAMMAR